MRALLLVILSIAFAATSLADVSPLISYQGVLTEDNGDPLEGAHDLTFAIYNEFDDTSPAWSETHVGVVVEGGVFHVLLGGTTEFTVDLFDATERWIGVTVDNGTEILPRSQISSVPWALRAAVADVALSGGGSGDGHSLDAVDGDPVDVVFVDENGDVGIGTTNPSSNLSVGDVGDSRFKVSVYQTSVVDGTTGLFAEVGSPSNSSYHAYGARGIARPTDGGYHYGVFGNAYRTTAAQEGRAYGVHGTAGNTYSGYNYGVYGRLSGTQDGVGVYGTVTGDVQVSGQWAGFFNGDVHANGNVGIGTMSPAYKLDVSGDVRLTGALRDGAGDGGMIGQYLTSTGTGIQWADPTAISDGDWQIDGPDMYATPSGNVGIGTTSPAGKLHVNGNIHVQDGNRFCFIHQNPHWAMGKDINDIGGTGQDLQVQAAGSTDGSFQIISLHGSYPFTSECRLQVNLDDGNVGIGTTTPARTLHVNDVMRLEPRASAPSNPSKGDIYMDDTINKLMVYDGAVWQACW